jgi:hypothetical protein
MFGRTLWRDPAFRVLARRECSAPQPGSRTVPCNHGRRTVLDSFLDVFTRPIAPSTGCVAAAAAVAGVIWLVTRRGSAAPSDMGDGRDRDGSAQVDAGR